MICFYFWVITLNYLYTISAFICWYSTDAYVNIIQDAKVISGIIINKNKISPEIYCFENNI